MATPPQQKEKEKQKEKEIDEETQQHINAARAIKDRLHKENFKDLEKPFEVRFFWFFSVDFYAF